MEVPVKGTGEFGQLLLLITVVGLSVPIVASNSKPNEEKDTLVAGTGNIVAVVTRTSEPLSPPCVTLVRRVGSASFSGLIENAPDHGRQESRILRDACEDPIQGTNKTTYVLDQATVAGRTGGLILEASGIFDGDATSPAGSRTRLHFTIRGVGKEQMIPLHASILARSAIMVGRFVEGDQLVSDEVIEDRPGVD
jgi:hypothetical protein